MAFVYERVGEENEKLWKEIGWRDWGNDLIGFYAKSRWCADKEHGVYMLPIGSFRGETPDYYDLAYKNIGVRMERGIDLRGRGIRGYIFVRIDRVCIPKSIWEYRDDIYKYIKDAFVCYEIKSTRLTINKVDVEINCEPECVETDYNGK